MEKDCVKRTRTMWRDNKYQERQKNKKRGNFSQFEECKGARIAGSRSKPKRK